MIKDTPFTSADMVLMIVLQRKMRQWKKGSLQKGENHFFDLKGLTNLIKEMKAKDREE